MPAFECQPIGAIVRSVRRAVIDQRSKLTAMKFLPFALLLFVVGCGGKDSSPTGPGGETTYTLSGIVTSGGLGLPGVTLLIADGPRAGTSTVTTASGNYSFVSRLPQSSFTLNASLNGYTPQNKAVTMNSDQVVSFALAKINPLFVAGGIGDTVFDMPTYVSRVRITGTYTSFSSNFIVRIGGRLIVNELVGTAWNQTNFSGTYVTTGGVVEIVSSSGVSWSFTEVR